MVTDYISRQPQFLVSVKYDLCHQVMDGREISHRVLGNITESSGRHIRCNGDI